MIEFNCEVAPGFIKVCATAHKTFSPRLLSSDTPFSPIQLQNVAVNDDPIFEIPPGIDLEKTPFGPSLLCMEKTENNKEGILPITWQDINEGDKVEIWVFNTSNCNQVFNLKISG